ncbi:unnamed protein product, partial [Brassica rapa subsp. trilocularis]
RKKYVWRKLRTLVPLSSSSPSKSYFLIFVTNLHLTRTYSTSSESHHRVEHTVIFSRHARFETTNRPPPPTNPIER